MFVSGVIQAMLTAGVYFLQEFIGSLSLSLYIYIERELFKEFKEFTQLK
jgi:hypothetical protein